MKCVLSNSSNSFLNKKYNIIFYFLVCFKALSYWFISWWQHSSDPLSTIVMYRVGDFRVFPLISALGRFQFTEFCLYDLKGTGLLSFPFGSTLIHSLCYHFLGTFGFILADLIVAIIYYIILSRLLEFIGIPHLLAKVASLLIVSGVVNFFLSLLSKFIFLLLKKDIHLDYFLWGWRIPRPFVSEIFLLICIYCILALSYSQSFMSRKHYWFILGSSSAVLLQGDLYSATNIVISIFCLSLGLFIFKKDLRICIVKGIFLFFLTLVIFSYPFFLQRLSENPDVPRRLGLFPISRMRPLLLYGETVYCVLALVIILASTVLLLIKHFKKIESNERVRKSVIVLFCLNFVSFLSQPISIILLGKAIHIDHFNEVSIRMAILSITIFVIYTLYLFYPIFEKKLIGLGSLGLVRYNFLRKSVIIILIFISLSVIFKEAYNLSQNNQHMFEHLAWSSLNYRKDFVLLSRELEKKDYRDCKVIGTFDCQIFSWWVSFKHGYSYIVDPTLSTAPDYEIESRFIKLCKIIGMPLEDFKKFSNQRYIQMHWLSASKYQASTVYTFSSLSDYDEDAQRTIRASTVNQMWLKIIPNSEMARLVNRYLKENITFTPRLDIIILTNDEFFAPLAPSSDKFMLTYKNSTFRVWKAKEPRLLPIVR